MKKGLFITFEGGEACGKSTQVQLFKQYVQTRKDKDNFLRCHSRVSQLSPKVAYAEVTHVLLVVHQADRVDVKPIQERVLVGGDFASPHHRLEIVQDFRVDFRPHQDPKT